MRINLAGNQSQDFLCKGDDDATCQSQEAVGTLRGIMGQTHLDDTPAEQDQTDSADEAENEIGQVIDDGQGVIGCRECGHGHAHNQSQCQDGGRVQTEATLHLGRSLQLVGVLVLLEDFHDINNGSSPC